jgi:hypothetical protein
MIKKSKTIILPAILIVYLFSLNAAAQITKNDLIGKYNMNHDGWEGTLVIGESKVDCASSRWCDLTMLYTDTKGKTYRAGITNISNNWQHITFVIDFPNNRQLFNGYFFSWNKTLMAGTTVWHNNIYGFYAKKITLSAIKANLLRERYLSKLFKFKNQINKKPGSKKDEITYRKIDKDGLVEIYYKSGKKIIYGKGSPIEITPNQDTVHYPVLYMATMELVPPIPDEPDINSWFEGLNRNLDDIMENLLNGDEVSFSNYKKALEGYSLVKRVNESLKMIGFIID